MKTDTSTTLAGLGLGSIIAAVTVANSSATEATFWLGLVAAVLQVVLGYLTNKE